jgi:hypothetical protein
VQAAEDQCRVGRCVFCVQQQQWCWNSLQRFVAVSHPTSVMSALQQLPAAAVLQPALSSGVVFRTVPGSAQVVPYHIGAALLCVVCSADRVHRLLGLSATSALLGTASLAGLETLVS